MAGPEHQNQRLAKIINSNLGNGRQLSHSKFLSQSLVDSANSTTLLSRSQLPELFSDGCDVKFQLVQTNSAIKTKAAMASSGNLVSRLSSSDRRSSLPLVPRRMDLLEDVRDQQNQLVYGAEAEQHASAANRRVRTSYGLNSSSHRDNADDGYGDGDGELVADSILQKEKYKKLDHLKFKKIHSSTTTTTSSTTSPSSTVIGDTARTCRVCGRDFPSGRALGGHMRIHGASAMATNSPGSTELQVNGGKSAVHVSNTQELATERQEKQESRLGSNRVKQESAGYGDGGSVSNVRLNDENISVSKFREKDCSTVKMKEFRLNNGGSVGAVRISKKHIKTEEGEEGADLNESFECTSPVDPHKPELAAEDAEMSHLGDGDVCSASHEFLSKKQSSSSVAPVLYELRRNPKPNQKFIKDQELVSASASANNGACNSQLSNTGCAAMASDTGANDNDKVTDKSTTVSKSDNEKTKDHKSATVPKSGNEKTTDKLTTVSKSGNSQSQPELNNQGQKQQQQPPLQQQTQVHPCSECGKVFSSWKALFGHMRCHPEREWRGIQKPDSIDGIKSSLNNRRFAAGKPSPKSEPLEDNRSHAGIKRTADMAFGSADIAAAAAAEIDTRSPVWPTRKRSKRRPVSQLVQPSVLTSDSSASMENKDHISAKDQEDMDMATWLVLLSSSGQVCTDPSTEDHTAFSHNSEGGLVKHSGTASGDDVDGGEDDEDYDDEFEARNYGADDDCENHDRNAAGLGDASTKYQCSTCKKCFNSHQALGGHRASHKKTKGCFAQTKSNDDMNIDVTDDQINVATKESPKLEHKPDDYFLSSEKCTWKTMRQLASGSGAIATSPSAEKEFYQSYLSSPITDAELGTTKTNSSSKKKFKGHECSICHRIFPSGQALGGHKRCHWTGEKMAGDTASIASSNNNSTICRNSDQKMEDWEGKDTPGSMQRRMVNAREDAMLDLNLPAPLDLDEEEDIENLQYNAMYGIKPPGKEQQQIMHSSPLVESNQAANAAKDQVKDWSVKDLLGATGDASLLEVAREIEVRYGFPPTQVWNDQWTNAVSVAKLPQVCTVAQPLI